MGDSPTQGKVEKMAEEPEPAAGWWEGIDTSTMDYVEYAAFEDAMTPEEYQRYINR